MDIVGVIDRAVAVGEGVLLHCSRLRLGQKVELECTAAEVVDSIVVEFGHVMDEVCTLVVEVEENTAVLVAEGFHLLVEGEEDEVCTLVVEVEENTAVSFGLGYLELRAGNAGQPATRRNPGVQVEDAVAAAGVGEIVGEVVVCFQLDSYRKALLVVGGTVD